MSVYSVSVDVCGYSRGYEVWEVEAESEEDARKFFYSGKLIEDDTLRDDREREVGEVVLCTP